MSGRRHIFIILIALWAVAVLVSIWAGTCGVSFQATWREISLPRLLLGTLAGASLAMAGAMFQALFRNPLASPYTLGVSSGASLGAAATILLAGGGLLFNISIVTIAAFIGALVCVTIVYIIAHLKQGQSVVTLLLAGITIGFICSALIVLILFLAEKHDLGAILQWMMGSLEVVGFDPVYEAGAMITVAALLAAWLHRDLDLLMMGETLAAGRGVNVRRSRNLIYISASLLTAGIVAHCGPIGFVGLVVPHIMRQLIGPAHRYLLPACALGGAAFLPLCDTLARNAMWWIRGESREMPVGVLTNLIGGLFFLYLLLTRKEDRPGL
jgi:iron complex transport system permease protein